MKKIKTYILLWSTQSLSALGSGMTSYALILWLYLQSGSALKTALLSICSYAPYVAMSIFAGSLTDRLNKKKTMLFCDLIAAVGTVAVLVLIKTDTLQPWHLYIINAVNGLMNTLQQPASEVAATMLIPKEYYQKTSGMRSFSQSLNSILTPIIATALFSFSGIGTVIAVDLITFAIAFLALGLFISIPEPQRPEKQKESIWAASKSGLKWLKNNPLILELILFLSCINLVASTYRAVLPAMIIPKANGGETVLGIVNTCVGVATLVGSIIAAFVPAPKNRVRAICVALFISMSTENFILALGNTPLLWCVGAVFGWLMIPFMGANLDVIFRNEIPADMQGRVYACRNTLQFFTIPIGYFLGGHLTDNVFEPFAQGNKSSLLTALFGEGKGSGAAMMFFIMGITGVAVCLVFSVVLRKHKWTEKNK